MELSIHGDKVVVRTRFSDRYDLSQIFQGVCLPEQKPDDRNMPVDFLCAGLVRREARDIWHIDRMLAYSTDEATPLMIGGGDVGANHGYPCLVRAKLWAEGGALAAAQPDTVWTDGAGHLWKIIRRERSVSAERSGTYLLLGEMTGTELTVRAFRSDLSGDLSLGGAVIHAEKIAEEVDLTSAVRHTLCEVHFDKERGTASIAEEYDILHPGFRSPKTAITCDTLCRVRNVYSVADDGTVTVDFTVTARQPLRIDAILGTMYQEKCDLGGGIRRTIPGTRPFTATSENGETHTFDFSRPVNTSGDAFPGRYIYLTREYWADPDVPPIMQRDEMRDAAGNTVCTFEAGFESRPCPVRCAWQIVPSRKTYPVFADDLTLAAGETVSGRAFRRYVAP